MTQRDLHLSPFFLFNQFHLRSPLRAGLMAMVVLIRHLALDHEVELVVTVGVDLDGAVVAVWDVRPDGCAEGADFCVFVWLSARLVLEIEVGEGDAFSRPLAFLSFMPNLPSAVNRSA